MTENFRFEKLEHKEKEGLSDCLMYINAGGRGERLASVLPQGETGIAKALIPFAGKLLLSLHQERAHKKGLGV